MPNYKTDEQKLQSAIRRVQAGTEKRGDCLIWKGFMDRKGYGMFSGPAGKKVFVHRFAYTVARGPIPEGMVLNHSCRVRACCNPDHLAPVTNDESLKKARSIFRKGGAE